MSKIYPSYLFHEHDPVLDWIDTIMADSGLSTSFVEQKSGVRAETLRRWRLRKTRHPQFSTIAAVARCLGETSIPIRRGRRSK